MEKSQGNSIRGGRLWLLIPGIAGVVEFYRKDPGLSQLRASLQRSIWLAAAASSLVMAAVLMIGLRKRPSV